MSVKKICKSIYRIIKESIDFLNNIYNQFIFFIYHVKVGQGITIHGRIKIYGCGNLILDDNITINSAFDYNPIGGQSGCSFLLEKGAVIHLHEGVGISNTSICSHAGVDIGKDVFIGGNCKIYDTDFHSISKEKRLEKPDLGIKKKRIIISDGAFIGGSSIILKGVTIGENSVIGAGSVVSRDIPANQIWAGNPVRFIRNIQ